MRRVFFVFVLLMIVGALAVQAQDDAGPSDVTTTMNRTSELAWMILGRNQRIPDILLLTNAPIWINYSPFNPSGVPITREQSVLDELYFQSAYTHTFKEWLVIAEGDLTGVYAFQEGDFVGEYYGTPPSGEHQAGTMVFVDRFVDGRLVEANTAWDQQGFLENLGWNAVDYPDYTVEPWGIALGTTSSTSADHHIVLDALYGGLCAGCSPDFSAIYADDVVVHDYTQALEGLPAVSEQMGHLMQIADLSAGVQKSVCEGDLCISYVTFSFTADDAPQTLIWAAVHRFVDGRIAEEWWQYDNSVLWPLLDAME